MADDYERLLSKLRPGRLEKDSENYKIMGEVFDQSTLMALYWMTNHGTFDELHGTVSTGKEANIFYAQNSDGEPVAIKIYRVATSDFQTKWRYLTGDPRFQTFRGSQRHIVNTWVKREYKNLQRAKKAGVRAPTPIVTRRNVLAMEFLGEEGHPYPRMKDTPPENPQETFETLVSSVKKLYQDAKLVHADLSEYNVLLDPDPIIIDFSMSTDIMNPSAEEWLERDIRNLIRYFSKIGAEVPEFDELLKEMKEG